MNDPIEIFTDGACRGNPGPGGWGAVLRSGGREKLLSGGASDTTNNRMELTAAIEALEALRRPCRVRLSTDSTYLKNGITQWIPAWKRRDWKTADRKPVKNVDLWRRLERAASPHEVEWVWVRGHSGHEGNEKADALARSAVGGPEAVRQVVLDTETTGLEPEQGHRIIEIGGVELVNRRLTDRRLHYYLQPDREIDDGALEVHGITREFLQDKPRFAEVHADILSFVSGAEVIIHNAPFDVAFLDSELARIGDPDLKLENRCRILDSLALARQLHPGQRNNLDALCKRYGIDNSARQLHGALLDAEILADVYLAMTGGQAVLALGGAGGEDGGRDLLARRAAGAAGRLDSRWRARARMSWRRTPASLHSSRRRAAGSACGCGSKTDEPPRQFPPGPETSPESRRSDPRAAGMAAKSRSCNQVRDVGGNHRRRPARMAFRANPVESAPLHPRDPGAGRARYRR